MEKEPISKKEQTRDGILIALSGGIIGVIGTILEINTLSEPNPNINSVIWSGGATLIGASLAVTGLVRFVDTKRVLKKE